MITEYSKKKKLTIPRLSSTMTKKHWKLQICFCSTILFFFIDVLYCCFACCLVAHLWGIFPICNVNEKICVRLPALPDDFLFFQGTERGEMNWYTFVYQNRIIQKMQNYTKYYLCRAHPWRFMVSFISSKKVRIDLNITVY